MEIFSFISRQKDFIPLYPVTIITQNTTSSWMTLCIDMVSIMFSGDALPTRKLNKFWMTATLEHVAIIFLGWLQPRKSFTLVISGLQSSKIVMRHLRNSHLANTFIWKITPTLLFYTSSLQLTLLQNGLLILCIVILHWLGGMVTSLILFSLMFSMKVT